MKWFSCLGIFGTLYFGLLPFAYAQGMGSDLGFIPSVLIVLLVILIVFLLLREVNCWYWKINERVSLLTEIKSLLKDIQYQYEVNNKSETKHASDDQASVFCTNCGARIGPDSRECESCGMEVS